MAIWHRQSGVHRFLPFREEPLPHGMHVFSDESSLKATLVCYRLELLPRARETELAPGLLQEGALGCLFRVEVRAQAPLQFFLPIGKTLGKLNVLQVVLQRLVGCVLPLRLRNVCCN
ncbi:MAG: hypothetical protein QF395_05140 [Arenicellales bacterium]|nr:hypothetical protein [Arenicellales bacterium]